MIKLSKVRTYPRSEIAQASSSLNTPHAIITMTGLGNSPITLQNHDIAALYLNFDDVSYGDTSSIHSYTSSLASTVVSFIKAIEQDAEILLINCDAGLSRSTGMAEAIADFYGIEIEHYNKVIYPNKLVYDLTYAALGGVRTSAFGNIEVG